MTPTLQQFDDRDDVLRRYEYEDRVVYAADLGPAADITVEGGVGHDRRITRSRCGVDLLSMCDRDEV